MTNPAPEQIAERARQLFRKGRRETPDIGVPWEGLWSYQKDFWLKLAAEELKMFDEAASLQVDHQYLDHREKD